MWCIIIYSQTYNVSENSPPIIKRMTYACGAWLYSQTYMSMKTHLLNQRYAGEEERDMWLLLTA